MRIFHLNATDVKSRITTHEPLDCITGPRWHEWKGADVAALPIEQQPLNIVCKPLKLVDYTLDGCALFAGMHVSIVGYILGLAAANFPIWKSGWLACDPHPEALPLNDGHRVIYIDATTRGGASGSPVFLRFSNNVITCGKEVSGSPVSHFIGIYSGREKAANHREELDGHSDVEPNIGIVWPSEIVKEVLNNPPPAAPLLCTPQPAASPPRSPAWIPDSTKP